MPNSWSKIRLLAEKKVTTEPVLKTLLCFFFVLFSMIHQEPQSSGLSSRLTGLQEDVGKSPGRKRSVSFLSAITAQYDNTP